MAHPKGIYDFYKNSKIVATGTFELAATKLKLKEATLRKKCQKGEYTKIKIGKEKPFDQTFRPKKRATKAVETKYKLISADYENIQVVELENGERAVMSKKTGKLIKSVCTTSRRGRLLV